MNYSGSPFLHKEGGLFYNVVPNVYNEIGLFDGMVFSPSTQIGPDHMGMSVLIDAATIMETGNCDSTDSTDEGSEADDDDPLFD